jgi:hypothetical protein
MKELLYQCGRVIKHGKSISLKLLNKLMKGANLTAQAIVSLIVFFVGFPLAIATLGSAILVSIVFMILGGTPTGQISLEQAT